MAPNCSKRVALCIIELAACLLAGCSGNVSCDPKDLRARMSKEDVVKLCGKPPKIEYSNNNPERWLYGETASTYAWVEFSPDGRLLAWDIYVRP